MRRECASGNLQDVAHRCPGSLRTARKNHDDRGLRADGLRCTARSMHEAPSVHRSPSLAPGARGWGGARGAWRRAFGLTAALYFLMLCGLVVLLYWVGDRWWFSGLLAYFPRVFFGVPLLILLPGCCIRGFRRHLTWVGLALWLWLVPVMGFVWNGQGADAAAPRISLLTYNVGLLRSGVEPVCRTILEQDADVVSLQEVPRNHRRAELQQCLAPTYDYFSYEAEFFLASRFPLGRLQPVPGFRYRGMHWGARSMRYAVISPLGELALYAVHPGSARPMFEALAGAGLWEQLQSPQVFGGYVRRPARVNVETRTLQFEAAFKQARAEQGLVVVAGDTNLPSGHPLLRREPGRFVDGFRDVGRGFGYTFPSDRPFLRIDRVFAAPPLMFTNWRIGCEAAASDHLCIRTELALAAHALGAISPPHGSEPRPAPAKRKGVYNTE